jgi:hypothetical protein
MKCKSVQHWLLQVQSLHVKDWPRNMNRHLKRCAGCARIARLLFKVEEAWRNQPVPAECAKAKAVFLAKLPSLEDSEPATTTVDPAKRQTGESWRTPRVPAECGNVLAAFVEKPTGFEKPGMSAKKGKAVKRQKPAKPAQAKPMVQPWRPMRWIAVAAMLFIGVIVVGLLLPGPSQASGSDVVDRLVEWNLEMANAGAKERQHLLEEHEAKLKSDLHDAQLSPEERELADELFEYGRRLAITDDPVTEAEVVAGIAAKLLSRAAVAVEQGNEKETECCGRRYGRFNEYAVKPMWIRIAQIKMPENKNGFDKGGADKGGLKGFEFLMNQKKQFDKLKERAPEYSHPDLHKRFESFGKKGFAPGKMGGKT